MPQYLLSMPRPFLSLPQSFLSTPWLFLTILLSFLLVPPSLGCAQMDSAATATTAAQQHVWTCVCNTSRNLRNISHYYTTHACEQEYQFFTINQKKLIIYSNDSPVRISAIWVKVATAQTEQINLSCHPVMINTPTTLLLLCVCVFFSFLTISNDTKVKLTQ